MIIREWLKVPSHDLFKYLIRKRGIAESDIRRVRWIYDYDAVEVQLWNYRRIKVTGLEMARG